MRFIAVLLLLTVVTGCAISGRGWESSDKNTGPEFLDDGVRFSLYAPKAKKVCIAGDFNNWSKNADPMYDEDSDGIWTIVLPLKPGRYEYKFVIDGDRWVPDPANPHRVDDGFGGKNSIIVVGKKRN